MRIVENAFGILVSRFLGSEKPIALSPKKTDSIVKAACSLHNWLRKTTSNYISRESVDQEDFETIIPGSWRQELTNAGLSDINTKTEGTNYSNKAA